MGRSPCCDKVGLKKGPWTPEEDQKLLAYIEQHGHGSWRALPDKAGLQRCGKSCRLRWTNYLRPDIKRGKFSLQEEQTIIQLHALLGNRWSAIATHLPKRTDNEIKNYWNTHLKKRLTKMGIDPVTHKPKNDALSGDGQSKNAANLSHMAQWESARLEAEARLVRESKLRSQISTAGFGPASGSVSVSNSSILKPWHCGRISGLGESLESPTSTLTFSDNAVPIISSGPVKSTMPVIEFVGTSGSSEVKQEGTATTTSDHHQQEWKGMPSSNHQLHENSVSLNSTSDLQDMPWSPESMRTNSSSHVHTMEEGFTSLLLSESVEDSGKETSNNNVGGDINVTDSFEDNKNYWDSILNLVNSSPTNSPMF